MSRATPTTSATDTRFATSDVSTCAHSTLDRAIGIDWNRSKMAALQIEEQTIRRVRDPRGDRDEQDAGEHVVDVRLAGARRDGAAEHVDEQEHERDRSHRRREDRVGAAQDVAQRSSVSTVVSRTA